MRTISLQRYYKFSLKNRNTRILKTTLLFVLGTVLLSSILGSVILANNHVYAHALPVTENPPPNSIIKKGEPLPSKIIIDFSERPDPSVSTIQVLNSKNERIDKGDFAIIGNHGRKAMTTLYSHKLTDGVYTVSWMTQSADDGHIARGSYAFGIGNIGPGSSLVLPIFPHLVPLQKQIYNNLR